ncbi:restriction endonuclease subunit S [Vreelandella venusta]|uniref:restriction endonuclease subunit S n=1 Tax=Vreelandella venusta TaxID=44935 RepID=UPI003C2C8851
MPEHNLPSGWACSTLGLVCSKLTDGSHNPPKGTDVGQPMLSAKNIQNGIIDFRQSHRLIPAELFESEDRRTSVSAHDVLLTIVGALGRTAVVPENCGKFTLQRSVAVLAAPGLNTKAFRYSLESYDFQQQILDNAKGTAQKGIYLKKLRELTVPIPPLAEQKVIADKLDTLLAQVDNTKARLERIPAILKRFRQSVLAAAVSGRLTEEWRGTPSCSFGKPPLTIGPEKEEAPDSWRWEKLTDLAILESGHTPRKSKPEYWKNGDVPWISLQDIRKAHGKVITKTKFMPNMEGIKNSSARLLPAGTVCFSRDISVGYTTVMGREMATTQHFVNWICGERINNIYLMYSFMAAKNHLTISGQGSTVKTIYMPACKQFRLLTPPLEEQTEIVRRVDQLFAHADRIEQQVNQALARVNTLTQSILAKAFRGELTEQWRKDNPELTSGENSAEALLERIKAERAAKAPAKRTRKKATT